MYKYNCIKCKYHSNYKSQWNKHIETEKHKFGKRKIRSDKKTPPKCTQCDHIATDVTNLKLHILNNHSTLTERKKEFRHYCEFCDYGSFAKTSYAKHINTKKHKYAKKFYDQKLKVI